MTWAEDLITLLLSSWLIGGVFLDGWAHNTRPQLETFFTPWHAVFYSGFAAVAVWVCRSVWIRRGVPAGYGPALAGLVIFLLSGAGDMSWHLAFGIEQGIAALLSPTHLGLFSGAFLIVTAPLRSQWADPDPAPGRGRRAALGHLLPAVGSVTLAGSLCTFMFMYLHPMYDNIVSVAHLTFLDQAFTTAQSDHVKYLNIAVGVSGFIVSTVLLFTPLLFLLRRWRLPASAAVVVLGLPPLLVQALTDFRDIGLAELGLIGAAAVAVLLRLLDPTPAALGRLRVFFATAPALFWGIYFGGIALHDHGLGWKAEVWGGALVWSGLAMLALTLLMWPPAAPVAATQEAG